MVAAFTLPLMEGYVTLPQLAERLGIKTGGLRTAILRGSLKAEKFGPVWAVKNDEAERFINEYTGKPGPRPKRDA